MKPLSNIEIKDFLALPSAQRQEVLRTAISTQHAYHFARNAAYCQTVTARGVTSVTCPDNLALLLRPAALTFKGYAERIGPFPQDDPAGFLRWLSEQLSIPLPDDRWPAFRRRYSGLEALLLDIERIYADLGLEIVTSTGTSGRASMVVRDAATIELAVNAFFTGIRQVWGIQRGTALVFVMPRDTRVAMARTARFGTRQLDWAADSPIYYTMPFSATPDQLRVRAGRTFRPGVQGLIERRVLHPFMRWANEHLADPRYVASTLSCLRECVEAGQPVMLLGGLVQLHAIARQVSLTTGGATAGEKATRNRGFSRSGDQPEKPAKASNPEGQAAIFGAESRMLRLPPGSRVATGGGMKEQYPFTPAQIRADLAVAFGGAPISDVYGMAEANWAAFECTAGNHHIPPWVYAVVTDDDDRIMPGPDATGLLAFFDPIGGGNLIPPFFQTADRVQLINGGGDCDPALACPCGYDSPYIRNDIRRVDLIEEAGCAAQV
jgi:hypothetical protein